LNPAPKRKYDTSWKKFIEVHMALMWGCDFFTHEVWTTKGKLITYYVLVFIHLGTRRLEIVNATTHPTMEWTIQQARNFFYDMEDCPEKANMKYLLHDKGSQFRQAFQDYINTRANEEGEKMQSKVVCCPQMNGCCERVIQSIQNDCLNRLIIFGERMLKYTLKQYQEHYNQERHHQGIGNVIPFPIDGSPRTDRGEMKCKTRLGGLLRSYYREAV
jgi:putative transposase